MQAQNLGDHHDQLLCVRTTPHSLERLMVLTKPLLLQTSRDQQDRSNRDINQVRQLSPQLL